MIKLLATLCLTVTGLISCSGAEPKLKKVSDHGETLISDIYMALVESKPLTIKEQERLYEEWKLADTPMLLESLRYVRDPKTIRLLYAILREKTGKDLDIENDEWQQWLWAQKYEEHPDYASFKERLYKHIDPKFKDYFDDSPQSTIRLDEIRWGGVIQDGIPPLRNPKMLPANKASYLADTDVVFGIEVDGDFRAYPKRILAWHEMFTDTIQGVPLAGVY